MNPSAGRAGTTPGAKSTTGYLSVRFVEHPRRIDRGFNSSVIHVCFTGGLTEPSRS